MNRHQSFITKPKHNLHSIQETKSSTIYNVQIKTNNSPKKSIDQNVPTHIAIITDGNSRWAKQQQPNISRFLKGSHIHPNFLGHSKGGNRVISSLLYLKKHYSSVKYVTIYGFSSENWSRPTTEINDLWKVMERTLSRFHDLAIREKIVVKMIGELDDERIPQRLRNSFRQLELDTVKHMERWKVSLLHDDQHPEEEFHPLTLCLAINYGGRNDIVQASRRIAEMVSRGEMEVNEITPDVMNDMLSTCGIPQPDLLIRTGGEQRLSNFLLWNCAYSEIYFTDVLWPDFDDHQLDLALQWYETRERRFGGRRE
jgi:undecaprenyl diphosphate synthase